MRQYDDFAALLATSDYDNRDLFRFRDRQIGPTSDGYEDNLLHTTAGEARAGDLWAFNFDISIDELGHTDVWLMILFAGSNAHLWRSPYDANNPLNATIVLTGDEITDITGSDPEGVSYRLVNQDSSSDASHSAHVHAVRLTHSETVEREFVAGFDGAEFFD